MPEGNLPRRDWMGEEAPQSLPQREPAPQREAERRRLEVKHGAAPERLP